MASLYMIRPFLIAYWNRVGKVGTDQLSQHLSFVRIDDVRGLQPLAICPLRCRCCSLTRTSYRAYSREKRRSSLGAFTRFTGRGKRLDAPGEAFASSLPLRPLRTFPIGWLRMRWLLGRRPRTVPLQRTRMKLTAILQEMTRSLGRVA